MTRHRHDRSSADGGPDTGADAAGGGGLRIDKWLWCTRFFKTRGMAQAAVEGGHVQLGGERIKASRQVRVGDRLAITRAQERYVVDVLSIPARRGPAQEARQHYLETRESEAARAHGRRLNRLVGPSRKAGGKTRKGRPGSRPEGSGTPVEQGQKEYPLRPQRVRELIKNSLGGGGKRKSRAPFWPLRGPKKPQGEKKKKKRGGTPPPGGGNPPPSPGGAPPLKTLPKNPPP